MNKPLLDPVEQIENLRQQESGWLDWALGLLLALLMLVGLYLILRAGSVQ